MVAISIVLPTVDGREDIFGEVHAAYQRTPYAEIIVIRNSPTVGVAWQQGAEQAQGNWLHFANDDCLPDDGWYEDAIGACAAGYIPSASMRTTSGYRQSLPAWGYLTADWTAVSCCLIPFMHRVQWEKIGPMFTGHMYTDNWVSWRADQAGWPTVHRQGYSFTHFWARPGRGAGMPEHARMAHDEENFKKAQRMALAGEWSEPWPIH